MLNQLYQTFIGYALGGTVAVILFVLMYQKSSKVAQSGNRAKMATFSLAPAFLIVASLLATTVAFNFAVPRLQSALTSQPVMGAVEAGNVATQMIDNLLAAPPVQMGTGNLANFQPMQFQAPVVGGGGYVNPLPMPGVNGGAPAFQVEMPTAVPTVAQQPAVPTTEPLSNGIYTVQRGDSMYKIAVRLLGDGNRYVELCRVNAATVGRDCQLTPGMQISLAGVPASQQPLVFTQDDYQPLVLRSAADNVSPRKYYTQRTSTVSTVSQLQQVAPTATAVPLVFMMAMNTPTPTQETVTVPFVGPTQMPLVLKAAQD